MIFATLTAGICIGAALGGLLCNIYGPMPRISTFCYLLGAGIAALSAYYS